MAWTTKTGTGMRPSPWEHTLRHDPMARRARRFDPGDKVRVIGRHTERSLFGWYSGMDRSLGEVGTIEDLVGDMGYKVSFPFGCWTYVESDLEIAHGYRVAHPPHLPSPDWLDSEKDVAKVVNFDTFIEAQQ